MAIRTSTNFKQRTDLLSNVTPLVKYNSDYDIAPTGEWKPADWLPIQWTDPANAKDAFVISSGKVVALTTDGRVVPAGLRTKLQSGITYTATDVTYGVVDITTGEPLTGTATYTGTQVAQALVERGLVLETDIASVTAAEVIPKFISHPVGISAYDVFVWAGDEAELRFTNYQKQHLIQFLRQAQLIVPVMASADEASDSFDTATLDGGGSTVYAAGEFPEAGEYWDVDNIVQVNRYADLAADAPVVALGLAHQPVAANTDRTPFEADDETVLIRERASAALIKREGDWFLDAEVGVLFIHSDTWAALVAATTTVDFSYSYYSTSTADAERMLFLDGRPRPGDYVKVDIDSNLVVVAPTTVADLLDVVGRVHLIMTDPRDLFESVKTGWKEFSDKESKMPGSATKGYSDLISLADETVANELAIVFIAVH